MTTTPSLTSSAAVGTRRASRYGKQLASHLGRRIVSEWDEPAQTGLLQFDVGRCTMEATPDQLLLHVDLAADTDPDEVSTRLALIEDVVGRHLVRFGTRDELLVRWRRADGSLGREYANTEDGSDGHQPPA
jgi:uncharacterized protein